MEKNFDKELRILSQAITKALTHSEDVRAAIEKLKKKDESVLDGMFIMMLRLQSICIASDENNKKFMNPLHKEVGFQHIDGKKLSLKEIAFYEYCCNNFKEDEWLKENRVFFAKDEEIREK